MMTEMEYIKCLQDNNTNVMNDSSFFKSFINVEKSNALSKDEEKARNEENHALKDINDQLKKKVQDLTKQVEGLEAENSHLSNEHLTMLKKQDTIYKKGGHDDQSTLDDTNGKGNTSTMAPSQEEVA